MTVHRAHGQSVKRLGTPCVRFSKSRFLPVEFFSSVVLLRGRDCAKSRLSKQAEARRPHSQEEEGGALFLCVRREGGELARLPGVFKRSPLHVQRLGQQTRFTDLNVQEQSILH